MSVRAKPGEMVEVPEMTNQIQEWVEKNLEERVNMSEDKAVKHRVLGQAIGTPMSLR